MLWPDEWDTVRERGAVKASATTSTATSGSWASANDHSRRLLGRKPQAGAAEHGCPRSRARLRSSRRVLTARSHDVPKSSGGRRWPLRAVYGGPREELARFGDDLDLLVVGSRGHGPLGRVFHAGVSDYLARHAPCPLLIMPRGLDRTDPADVPDDTRERVVTGFRH